MARRTNRLSFERLENRDLMSGGLLAKVINAGNGPFLFINEAPGDAGEANAVQVTRLNNTTVRVTGLENSGGTVTRVNGHLAQNFTLGTARDLVVALGAGDDQVRVLNAKFRNVFIGTSLGSTPDNDTVDLTKVTTTGSVDIRTGEGADKVSISNSTIGDGPEDVTNIITGGGADQVFIHGSPSPFPGTTDPHGFMGDLVINTGGGADRVEIGANDNTFVEVHGNLIVNTFQDITEPDADVVHLTQTFGDNLVAIDTGAGNDSIQMGGVHGNDIVLVAGVGDDTAVLNQVISFNKMFLAMSEGNDNLNATDLEATNLLSIDGGGGFDRLQEHQDGPIGQKEVTGWEVINGVLVTGSHAGTVGGLGGDGSLQP